MLPATDILRGLRVCAVLGLGRDTHLARECGDGAADGRVPGAHTRIRSVEDLSLTLSLSLIIFLYFSNNLHFYLACLCDCMFVCMRLCVCDCMCVTVCVCVCV